MEVTKAVSCTCADNDDGDDTTRPRVTPSTCAADDDDATRPRVTTCICADVMMMMMICTDDRDVVMIMHLTDAKFAARSIIVIMMMIMIMIMIIIIIRSHFGSKHWLSFRKFYKTLQLRLGLSSPLRCERFVEAVSECPAPHHHHP